MPGLTDASESTVNRMEGEGAQPRGRTSQIQVLEGAQMKNFGNKKVMEAAVALVEMLRKVTDPEEENTIFARAKTARAPRNDFDQVMEAYIELLGADNKLAADAMERLHNEVSELLSHLPKLVETVESNGEAIVTAKLWMLKDKEAAENMAQSKAQLKDVKADLFLAEKANEELVGDKTELACDLSVSRNIISNQNDELATLQTDAEQRADLFAQMQGILGRMAAIGPSGAATATP